MYCTYFQFNIDKKCLQFLFTWIDIIDLDLKEIQERKKKQKTDSFCELILKLDNPPIFLFQSSLGVGLGPAFFHACRVMIVGFFWQMVGTTLTKSILQFCYQK